MMILHLFTTHYFVALGDVIKGLENPDMVLIGCEKFLYRQKILDLYKTIYDFEKYTLLNFGEQINKTFS